MLALLIGAGLVLTVATGGVQFRRFPFAIREVLGKLFTKSAGEGTVTPFQALATSLASTVGVGNIAGVSTAISLGGPGALFWMFFSGVVGMATKFSEIAVALHYREPDSEGTLRGGAMYILSKGMNMPWLGTLFALLTACASVGIGNMVQANSVADVAQSSFGVPAMVTGAVLAAATALVVLGGLRRIVEVSQVLVPVMCILYLLGNSGFVVGERGFGPATALDTVDAPILKPSAFGRGWDLGACVNGGVEGRAGDAPLPPKWLITMGLRQKNRFNECKACGCEPASNHMSGFGFSATDSDSGRRAHGSHERARSARKGRKKHVSVLPRPNRSPWIVVEQNHNGIGKLMVPAFQIYANMNVINDL